VSPGDLSKKLEAKGVRVFTRHVRGSRDSMRRIPSLSLRKATVQNVLTGKLKLLGREKNPSL